MINILSRPFAMFLPSIISTTIWAAHCATTIDPITIESLNPGEADPCLSPLTPLSRGRSHQFDRIDIHIELCEIMWWKSDTTQLLQRHQKCQTIAGLVEVPGIIQLHTYRQSRN